MAVDTDGSPLDWRSKDACEEFYCYAGGPGLFVKRLKANGLSDEQVEAVLICIQATCRHCWDDGPGCVCTWDD
jgi:hypothetical protein